MHPEKKAHADKSVPFLVELLKRPAPPRSVEDVRRIVDEQLGALPVQPSVLPAGAEELAFGSWDHYELSTSTSQIFKPRYQAGSEIDVAVFYQSFMHTLLALALSALGQTATQGRNQSDASAMTQASKRPDYCLWLRKLLVFKAEDKSGNEDLARAKADLTDKLADYNPLTCGELPFMFANAAAGSVVQFFAIDLHSKTAHAISDVLNLMDYHAGVRNRHRALITILNIARILVSWCSADLIREPLFKLYEQIQRHNSSLTFFMDHVAKRWRSALPHAEVERLLDVCAGCPYLVHLMPDSALERKGAWYEARFVPVGDPRQPVGAEEVRGAIRDVLRALSALHRAGFVHRDVRWPNVVFDPRMRVWVLIDLDTVGRVGDVPDWRNSTFPDEYKAASVPWTPAFDIHQVFVMLQGTAGAALTELREVLRSRPTAEDALARDARQDRKRV
jgi:hypothetical protein